MSLIKYMGIAESMGFTAPKIMNMVQQGIDSAQPQTVTVPYQPFQAVPNCVAYQYGMYNNGNLNGFWM